MTTTTTTPTTSLPSLSEDGYWIPWNDGHIPETLTRSSSTGLEKNGGTKENDTPGWLAMYPQYFDSKNTGMVKVLDHFVSPDVVHALFETTIQDKRKQSSWGTYVSFRQIQDYWANHSDCQDHNNIAAIQDESKKRDSLALLAVEAFLRATLSSSSSTSLPNKEASAWTRQDLEKIHGVAVWALAANVGSQVPYHLDYAEQVRYQSNCIVPPVLAGTLQCTPLPVQGGTFCIHTGGLQHYQQHGYKGIHTAHNHDKNNNFLNLDQDPQWIQIPYQFNRLTIASGHFPHFSTPIQSIATAHDNTTTTSTLADYLQYKDDSYRRRVILGFNVFLPDIGPLVQQAPEHSQAFRRKVALQRVVMAATAQQHNVNNNNSKYTTTASPNQEKNNNNNNDVQNQRFTLQNIKENPALRKLIVLAAKRIKEVQQQ